MNKITIQHTESLITQKGVAALIDFYKTISIETLVFPGLIACVTGVDSPFLNVVIDTRTAEKINFEQINFISDFFNRYHIPWVWLRTPLAKKNDLEYLGFIFLEEAPAMYFDLSTELPYLSTTFKIEEAGPNDKLLQWIESLNEGFPSADNGESYRILNANLLQKGEKKLKHFIAYTQNEVAAAGTLFLTQDSVMLHNLATKNKFKKQGIGKALALYRMTVAKKLGFKHCFLDASEDGYELHKRLGFKVYGMTKAYILEN